MRHLRFAAVLLSCAALLTAQTNRGGITGTVFDPAGAVVPGAKVTVTSVGTNQLIKVTTSGSGAYSVPNLDPVVYNVTVEAEGFNKQTIDNVKVDTANIATVDIKLQTGATSTEITVDASVATVNPESGTTGSTVTEREIQDAPLFNRSVLDLAVLQPNVSGDAGTENPALLSTSTVPGYNLSVNGGRPGSTQFLADGVNNTGVSYGRTMVSFTPETVQEFSIQTNAYSAEFGTAGGGIINTTTKSGTNRLTGTALWYNRNPAFAAAPYTLNTVNRPIPTQKDNTGSLTAGGPVVIPKLYNGRDKTFWFAAYEPHWRRDMLAQDAVQPTAAMLKGDFSNLVNTPSGAVPADIAKQLNVQNTTPVIIYNQYSLVNGNQFSLLPAPAAGTTYTPFPNNVIPQSYIDQSYLKAVKYIPLGGAWYLGGNGSPYNLPNPRLLAIDDTRYTLKIDHNISASHHLSGRYTSTPIIKTQVAPTDPTSVGGEYSYAKQAMLSYTWIITPTMFNDLRLNYTRGKFSSTVAPEWDPYNGGSKNLNTELGLPSLLSAGLPSLPYIGGQGSTNNNDVEERYDISDTLRITRGSMNWSMGFDVNRAIQNVVPLFGAYGGVYDFGRTFQTNSNGSTNSGTGGNTFAAFVLGVPFAATFRTTMIPYYYRWNSASGFVQNDWKVRPNLTLNLGVRYSLQLPRTEKYDHQGVFRPDLAQSYNLSTPLSLSNGEVVNSVLVPPFAFAGKGGRSRYLYPADYTDFEPRLGFAYSPPFLKDRHLTLRGGYGLSHVPITGFVRLPGPDFSGTTNIVTQTAFPQYVTRLGSNPPVLTAVTPDQAIFGSTGVPSDGLVYKNSLYYNATGYAVADNVHTPYSQSWNMTLSWQASTSSTVELSYQGNKGTHLFMPRENINPKDVSLLNAQDAQNVNTTGTINDPLGRVDPSTGKILTVQNGSLGSPYLGFSTLTQLYDAAANSIRHAGYVSVVHRARGGLTLTSNFTMGKSIDDASDGATEKNVATVGRVDGQVALGGTRKGDRSVSLFDQRYVWNATAIYDLPFGRGKQFLGHRSGLLDAAVGGWTLAPIFRLTSGVPAIVTMSDANQLGDLTHTARPNIAPGVPLINPNYDRNCPLGANCQPYINPSAFIRPDLGQLGNAPRSLDGVRGPWNRYFDLSVQKNWRLGERRRLQFRADFLNAFNHPNFRVLPGSASAATDVFGTPSTATTISNAEYDQWAAPNGQPASGSDAGKAQISAINAVLSGAALTSPNGAKVLPVNFFNIQLPANFWGASPNSFDVRTLQGLKLFRMRNTLNNAFGDLYNFGKERYIQFGLKLYF